MTHVITQNCCNEASCVPVCPVNCIHPTPDEPGYGTAEMLYIDPEGCIDCGACLDVCPVKAIEPDFELSSHAMPFLDLNAQYYRDPAHREYDKRPVHTSPKTGSWHERGSLRVAIVGSGPAACFVAEHLLGHRGLDVQIDILEKLPVPWGLVRFGVAPDHQGTKAVSEGFARTLRNPRVRLLLDVEVGRTISHDDLAARYHAVVYASGALGDRRLTIPGEDLPGSHSATEFVAWYNGHPDYADRTFDLSGHRAVVIGNGNVALDVARVLLSDVAELRRTDIADHAIEQLSRSNIREVVIVGRRGPAQAAFTTPELIGLSQTPGVEVSVEPDGAVLDAATEEWAQSREQSIAVYKARLLAGFEGSADDASERRVVLRFAQSPVALVGRKRVEAVRLVRNELALSDGVVTARPTQVEEELPAGLVLRSVGYRGSAMPGVPFDAARGVLPNVGGRVMDPNSPDVVTGIYAAGWIKRGPSGVIGTNKGCAEETVSALIDDWTNGRLAPTVKDDDLTSLLGEHLDLTAWGRIDKHERSEGRSASRPRVKITSRDELRAIGKGLLNSS